MNTKSKSKEKKYMLNLGLPENILIKIDKYKKENGFITRTNAIRHLLLTILKDKGY